MSKIRQSKRIVFFDAAGTLFEARGGVGEIYSRFARRHGLEVQSDEMQRRFLRGFRGQSAPLAFPAGTPEAELKELERGWWRDLALAVFAGFDFPRFDRFFAEVFEFFRSAEAWAVFDDVVPTLEALQARGMRLAVISNFDSRLFDLLRTLDLDRYFDSVHISTRVGAAKPDPAIFRAALGHHSVEPHQALHVGDSLREDVEGAAAAGLKAILIDRDVGVGDQARRINSVRRLDQIVEMLD